ncbi:protein BPS1, chloroplastic-like [Malania oleifera]|uniref:protein BPS1, chloroplastic-like n=1 Tax=Malania oleifera TaxID=397392 RepID=UPI0025AE50AD|nr:protein BPS1, chloroplastic-like [Malania oleifera]
MSRPQDPHRPFFPFGNPFRMILPKSSSLNPRLLALLNTFEETLAMRLRKLKATDSSDILSFSWMRLAMESLCETHTDIKTLITALELPMCDWEDKWIDVYLDDSVKLLDICIGFSSEISHLNQGHLLLQCALHNLNSSSSNQFVRARSSFDGWSQHLGSKNSRLENYHTILDDLIESLSLPKVKNSSKGKVLMHAIYGVKVSTVFVCSVFAAAFSGSAKMTDLQIPGTFLWAEAFTDLQTSVNEVIRGVLSSGRVAILKELEAVDMCVKQLYPMIQDGACSVEAEAFEKSILDLEKGADKLSQGLDFLTKEVDGFFQIVLTGRDALLCNIRESSNISVPVVENKREEQAAR